MYNTPPAPPPLPPRSMVLYNRSVSSYQDILAIVGVLNADNNNQPSPPSHKSNHDGWVPEEEQNNSELESSPAYIYGDILAVHLRHQEGSRRAQTRIFPGPCFLTRRQAFYIRQRNNLSPFCCDYEQHQYKAPTSAQFAGPQLPCALFLA